MFYEKNPTWCKINKESVNVTRYFFVQTWNKIPESVRGKFDVF